MKLTLENTIKGRLVKVYSTQQQDPNNRSVRSLVSFVGLDIKLTEAPRYGGVGKVVSFFVRPEVYDRFATSIGVKALFSSNSILAGEIVNEVEINVVGVLNPQAPNSYVVRGGTHIEELIDLKKGQAEPVKTGNKTQPKSKQQASATTGAFSGAKANGAMGSSVTEKPSPSPESEGNKEAEDHNDWPNTVEEQSSFLPVDFPYTASKDTLRIGYAILDFPVSVFSYRRDSRLSSIPSLRMSSTLKKNMGFSYETYSLSYVCNGPAEIKAGVQEVYEQIRIMPFLPVEGGPFGDTFTFEGELPFDAIAVRSFQISTVEGFPNSIKVTIDFDPFLYNRYLNPSFGLEGKECYHFSDYFCWPLFKLWCKSRAKSKFHGMLFNGEFKLSLPSPEAALLLKDITKSEDIQEGDHLTLQSFKDALTLGGFKNNTLQSANIKQIYLGDINYLQQHLYMLKFNNKESWQAFIDEQIEPETSTREPAKSSLRDSVIGLLFWDANIANFNFLDTDRNLSPISAQVPSTFVSQTLAKQPIKKATSQQSSLSDYTSLVTITKGDMKTQIEAYASTAGISAEALTQEPWRYFSVVVRVTSENEKALITEVSELEKETKTPTYEYSSGSDRLFQQEDIFETLLEQNEDLVITRVSGGKTFNLATKSFRGNTLPLHEYMGANDTLFVVEGTVFGVEPLNKLKDMKVELDQLALNKFSKKHLIEGRSSDKDRELLRSFLRIENELFQLLDMKFGMPMNLDINSIEGHPGAYQFSLTFIDYDPKILDTERIQYMPTSLDSMAASLVYGFTFSETIPINPTYLSALEQASLQASLRTQEVYPDLSLPKQGEVNYWVSSCKKIADLLVKSDKPNVDALIIGSLEVGKNLTTEEIEIAKHIAPLLTKHNVRKIAGDGTERYPGWNPKVKRSFSDSTYADPDFFIFYDPFFSWEYAFDSIAEQVHGKREGLKSVGPIIDEKDPVLLNAKAYLPESHLRMYDPNNGHVVLENNYEIFMYPGEKAGEHIQSAYDNAQSLDPNVNIDDLKQAQEDGIQQWDSVQNNWWAGVGGFSVAGSEGNEKNLIISNPDVISYFLSDVLPEGEAGSSQVSNPFKGILSNTAEDPDNWFYYLLTDPKFLNEVMQETLKDLPASYHKSKWSSLGEYVSRTHLFQHNLTGSNGLVGYQESKELMKFFFKNFVFDNTRKINTNDLYSQWKNQKPNTEVSKALFEDIFNLLRRRHLGAGSEDNGYTRTLKRYQSFQYHLNNPGKITSFEETRNEQENLLASYDLVDSAAARYKVDPNVVRSVFYFNDGFGARRNRDTVPGALNLTWAGKHTPGGVNNYGNVVHAWTKRYSELLSQLNNIPSLALLAISAETIGSDFNGKDETLTKENLAILKVYSSKVHSATSREAKARHIAEALADPRFAGLRDYVNNYWAVYLNISRSLGAVPNNTNGTLYNGKDIYFDPQSLFILVDFESNTDTGGTGIGGTTGKTLVIPTAPSSPRGGSTRVSLTRVTAHMDPASIMHGGQDVSGMSVQERVALARKLDIALSPDSEASVYASLVDLRSKGPFGRLLYAFPSYQILLINEGFYWKNGNEKLWDQHYTRTGVASIEVFADRDTPSRECSITFSNMLYNLTAYAQIEALQHELSVRANQRFGRTVLGSFSLDNEARADAFQMFWESFSKQMPDEIKKVWQNNHLKQLVLSPGARLHVKMGYGAYAPDLTTVFNGTVVEAPVSEGYMTVMAVGDGYELLKPTMTNLVQAGDSYAFNDGGPLGTGKDPSAIIMEAAVGASVFENMTGGFFRDKSKGVQHFGNVYFGGGVHYPAEMQINIYSSKPTTLEQGIPMLQNYWNSNAICNWEGVNLFSVQVNKPTLWAVMEVCRRACLDYVASAEIFSTRSTMYFGKWWWPYHYDYSPSILTFHKQVNDAMGGVRASWDLSGVSPDENGQIVGNAPALRSLRIKNAFLAYVAKEGSLVDIQNYLLDGRYYTQEFKTTLTDASDEIQGAGSGKEVTGTFIFYFKQVPDRKGIPSEVLSATNPTVEAFLACTATFDYLSPVVKSIKILGGGVERSSATYRQTLEDGIARSTEEYSIYTTLARTVATVADWVNVFASTDRGELAGALKGLSWTHDVYKENPILPRVNNGNAADMLKDVKILTSHLKWKNYMQAYIAYTDINLIANEIVADGSLVYTDAVGVHKYNGVLSRDTLNKTITYSLDTDIDATVRKTMMVDTGLIVTGVQAPGKAFAEGILTFVPFLGHQRVNETPTTPAVSNGVIAALMDSVKEMYQGQMLMRGQPTIKPRDLVYVNDRHNDMKGCVFVKSVLHRLDPESGLVTVFSPDCVAFPHGSKMGYQLVKALSNGILQKLGSFYIARGIYGITWGEMQNHVRLRKWKALSGHANTYKRLLELSNVPKGVEDLPLQTETGIRPGTNTIISDSLKKALTENETKLWAQYEVDVEDYRSLGLSEKDAKRAALRKLESSRAVWVTQNQKSVIEAIAEADKDFIAKNQLLKRRTSDLNRAISQLDNAIIQLQTTYANIEEFNGQAFDADMLARLKKSNDKEIKAILKKIESIEKQIETHKKVQGELLEELDKIRHLSAAKFNELDREMRTMLSALQDLNEPHFFKRLWQQTFGGTVEAITAPGRGAASVYRRLKELTAIEEGLDPKAGLFKAAWRALSGKSKTRAILSSVKTIYTDVKTATSAAEKVGVIGDALKVVAVGDNARNVKGITHFAKDVWKGARLASYAPPFTLFRLIADISFMAIFDNLIASVNERWKARQVGIVMPLTVGDLPYTAGIRGHEGAVIGDDPSWADNFLLNLYHGHLGAEQGADKAGTISSFITTSAAFIGFEPPPYMMSPFDSEDVAHSYGNAKLSSILEKPKNPGQNQGSSVLESLKQE